MTLIFVPEALATKVHVNGQSAKPCTYLQYGVSKFLLLVNFFKAKKSMLLLEIYTDHSANIEKKSRRVSRYCVD